MGFWKSSDDKDTAACMTPEAQMQKEVEITRRSRKLNLIIFVLIIAGFFVYNTFFQAKSITATMDDQSFVLITPEDQTIAFYLTDVKSVELGNEFSSFDRGALQSGTEDSSCCSGTYINDALGEYQLHVNLKVDPYVIVRYTDGILVFNTPTANETTAFYTKLLDAANS